MACYLHGVGGKHNRDRKARDGTAEKFEEYHRGRVEMRRHTDRENGSTMANEFWKWHWTDIAYVRNRKVI